MGPELYVGSSEIEGRGVFSTEIIEAGSMIELCPVIEIPIKDVALIHKTHLHDYYFNWGEEEKEAIIALGFGSIYNHSYDPNAKYEMDFESKTIDFLAIKDIPAHTEILVNYNGEPDDKTKLWFNNEK